MALLPCCPLTSQPQGMTRILRSTCRLDDHGVEVLDAVRQAPLQDVREVLPHRAADAPVHDLDDLLLAGVVLLQHAVVDTWASLSVRTTQ